MFMETENEKLKHKTKTASGLYIDLLNPKTDMITIEDIAKGLSFKSWMSGQIPRFYSIAEHCMVVEYLFAQKNPEDIRMRLVALLNNAAKAYIGDIPYDIKKSNQQLFDIEDNIQHVIMEKFGLNDVDKSEIEKIELKAITIENDTFFDKYHPDNIIYYMSPEMSYSFYCDIFNRLINQI